MKEIQRVQTYSMFMLRIIILGCVLLNFLCFILLFTETNNLSYLYLSIVIILLQLLSFLYFHFMLGSKRDLFIKEEKIFLDNKFICELSDLIEIKKITNFKYTLKFKNEDKEYFFDVFLSKKLYEELNRR